MVGLNHSGPFHRQRVTLVRRSACPGRSPAGTRRPAWQALAAAAVQAGLPRSLPTLRATLGGPPTRSDGATWLTVCTSSPGTGALSTPFCASTCRMSRSGPTGAESTAAATTAAISTLFSAAWSWTCFPLSNWLILRTRSVNRRYRFSSRRGTGRGYRNGFSGRLSATISSWRTALEDNLGFDCGRRDVRSRALKVA